MINEDHGMIALFMWKEARSSVAMDKDPDMKTRSVGLLNDPDLYGIGVKIMDRKTKEVIWKGSVAEASQTISWMR